MMHECLRCGYKSDRYDSFKRHLFGTKKRPRKSLCKSLYLDVSPKEMMENYDSLYEKYQHMRNNIWKCSCGMETKYKSNFKRHKAKCLKDKKIENQLITKEEALLNKIEQLQRSNIELMNLIYQNTNEGNTFLNGNNIEGSTVKRNIQQNQTNVVNNINNYGTETREHISVERMIELGECPPDAVPKLVEEIHYKNPKNMNINYPNVRDSQRGEKYENGRWQQTSLPFLVDELFVNKYNIFNDFIEERKHELPIEWVYEMNKMLVRVTEDLSARKDQERRIKDVMINNRHLIKK